MSTRLGTMSALAVVFLIAAAPDTKAKSGSPITACGQVVTTNAVLTQDLDCPGSGVVVGAAGITIDLTGFTLRGDRSSGHYGIDDQGGFDGVTVENGVLRGFAYGVLAADDADKVTLSNLAISGNVVAGIRIGGDSAMLRSSTVSANSFDGVEIEGTSSRIDASTVSGNGSNGITVAGASASVRASTASGNGASGMFVSGDGSAVKSATASGNGSNGILLQGSSPTIQSSTTSGNVGTGIYVAGDAAVVRGNRAEANGFTGGTSDSTGLGIYAAGYTTAPVGRNVVRGNDDPSECSPAVLC
jgi:hypothetical protein